jgi:ATP-grasp domain
MPNPQKRGGPRKGISAVGSFRLQGRCAAEDGSPSPIGAGLEMKQSDSNLGGGGEAGPQVLLTATNRWPSTTRLAICLTKTGCRISAVCPKQGHPLTSTSVVRDVFPYSSLRPLDSLQRAIEATNPQLVIPSDDRGVQHLHELYDRSRASGSSGSAIAKLIERSLGSPESFPIVTGRYELLEIARQEGLRVPPTKLLKASGDLKSWQAGHDFPWVLKGDGTFGGRGVRIAKTLKEAEFCFLDIQEIFGGMRAIKRAVVNRDPFWLRPWWNKVRPAVIVQSYVVGRPANCAFLCWQGELLACISVEVVSSDGMTGPASIVRIVDNPEMTLAAERLSRRLGLSGFFGLDFMIEDGGKATYLIEMNPRCTPLSHLQLGKGRDLIGALSAKLVGRPVTETPPVTEKDLIAYFPQAWRCHSEFLGTSFQDIPQGEPKLVEELMRPWPDRSLLYRLVAKLSGASGVAEAPLPAKDGARIA